MLLAFVPPRSTHPSSRSLAFSVRLGFFTLDTSLIFLGTSIFTDLSSLFGSRFLYFIAKSGFLLLNLLSVLHPTGCLTVYGCATADLWRTPFITGPYVFLSTFGSKDIRKLRCSSCRCSVPKFLQNEDLRGRSLNRRGD